MNVNSVDREQSFIEVFVDVADRQGVRFASVVPFDVELRSLDDFLSTVNVPRDTRIRTSSHVGWDDTRMVALDEERRDERMTGNSDHWRRHLNFAVAVLSLLWSLNRRKEENAIRDQHPRTLCLVVLELHCTSNQDSVALFLKLARSVEIRFPID